MDYKDIKALLHQYFEGETSLQEEATLKEYFSQSTIDDRLVSYQPLFQYFEEELNIELDDQFDDQLLSKLDTGNQKAKVVSLRMRVVYRVAAAVALIMAAWWSYQSVDTSGIQQQNDQTAIDWSKYEPQSEEEAQEQLAEAFQKLSPKAKIDWSKYEPQTEEEALEITTRAFRKLSSEVSEGTTKATKEVSKVQQLGRYFE